MINTKELKVSKRIAIILLIVVFSMAGIISCGGADITGTGGRSYSSVDVDDNTNSGGGSSGGDGSGGSGDGGSSGGDSGTTTKWDPSYYYRLRVPFAVSGDGYTNVSYADTNTLKQLWFDQINRKAVNDGRVFAIRNKANNRNTANFQNRHTDGQYSAQDYYYFNENGDIVWKEDNTVIKKFMGATIVRYRDVSIQRGRKYGFINNLQAIVKISWTEKNINTIGAVYANTMTTEEARAKYLVAAQQSRVAGPNHATSGDNKFKEGVFDFITYRHNVETYHDGWQCANNLFERQYIEPGFVEILVMYDYYDKKEDGAAAVHSYYPYYGVYNYYKEYANHPGVYFTPQNMPYMTNHNIYLAQRPEFTMKQLTHTAAFTDNHRGWNFMFMPGQKDISETRRVVRINNGIIR